MWVKLLPPGQANTLIQKTNNKKQSSIHLIWQLIFPSRTSHYEAGSRSGLCSNKKPGSNKLLPGSA